MRGQRDWNSSSKYLFRIIIKMHPYFFNSLSLKRSYYVYLLQRNFGELLCAHLKRFLVGKGLPEEGLGGKGHGCPIFVNSWIAVLSKGAKGNDWSNQRFERQSLLNILKVVPWKAVR